MTKPTDGQLPPPPVPPGPERDTLVAETCDKALSELNEARSLSPKRNGGSIAHSSYYAMFWLARAVIAKHTGTYHWRHDTTEKQFREIVVVQNDANLERADDLYVDAAHERGLCDYDRKYRPTAERAEQILEGAEEFFRVVVDHFALPLINSGPVPDDSEDGSGGGASGGPGGGP